MLKRRKKLMAKMMVLTMFANVTPVTVAFAAETSDIATNQSVTAESDFTFDAATGTIKRYNGTASSVVIPSTIGGVAVTSIGSSAFSNYAGLSSVTIPNSVTSIGSYAFNNCTNLTSITIPSSVTSIKDYSFNFCVSLTSVTIPNGVTSIGAWAFNQCYGLANIQIPDSVTSIGTDAFRFCRNLSSVKLSNNLTSLGLGAFDGCSSLTNITLPNSLTSLGDMAFGFCSKLTSITIPNSITTISDSAFNYCKSLSSVTIPDSVTSIESGAFENCSSLTSITIPDSVTNIDSYAFEDCDNTTFYVNSLPAKQRLIESGINASKIIINGQSSSASQSDFTFDASTGTITSYNGSPSEVVIPGTINGISVNSIGECAFWGRNWVTKVTIPDSVTTICSSAFGLCTSLTDINIPGGVSKIEEATFYGCRSLTTLTIPNTITSIGPSAFSNCSRLTKVTIPNSVTSITDYAFGNCENALFYVESERVKQLLISDHVAASKIILSDQSSSSQSDFTFDASTGTITKYIGTNPIVVIPSTINGVKVTSIGNTAFQDNTNITSVEIPSGVTSIGIYSFYRCTELTKLVIPESVTYIDGPKSLGGCDKAIFYVGNESIKQRLISLSIPESKIILNGQTSAVKVTSILLSATITSMTVGQTETLTATILPSNAANKNVTWQSSNTAVATVDANGKVTAVGAGSATITATATDGSNISATKTITVTGQTTSNTSDSVLNSVSISGTEEVGHTLKAKVSYSGTKPGLEYQWQRASKKDGDYTDISGADDSEYKLKTSDKNKYIKVIVSATINVTSYDVEDITSKIDADSSDDDTSDSSSGITIGTSTSSSSSAGSSASTSSGANTSTSSYSLSSNWNSTNIIAIRPSTAKNVSSQGSGNTASTSNSFIISPAVTFTNPAGHPLTGWVYTSNKWYYLDKDGRAKVGWVFHNSKWYYLDQSGVMVTNTTIDGYTIGSDGAMI